MNKQNIIQASDRTTLSRLYKVSIETFNGWISVNPALKELLQPYFDAKKRTFPPDVVKKIFEILGEP